MRQAMEMHRANPVCATCHSRMDPIGFALENFDGVGQWRDKDNGTPIDASGKLPDGTTFNGAAGLKDLLLTQHRDEFISTFTEKLMTYALGRGLESYDRPAIRTIMRDAAKEITDQYPGAHPRHYRQPAVSDEENQRIMIMDSNVITKKALARRTFLRGLGTVLALPLLDSMIPAFPIAAATNCPRTNRPSAWRSAMCRTASFRRTGCRRPMARFRVHAYHEVA